MAEVVDTYKRVWTDLVPKLGFLAMFASPVFLPSKEVAENNPGLLEITSVFIALVMVVALSTLITDV